MTYWIWAALAMIVGVDVIVYAQAGSEAFWWVVFGQLVIVFVVSVVEVCRKASDR